MTLMRTRGRLARKHFSTGAHPAAETPFYIAAASVSARGNAQCVWSHESSISSSYFPRIVPGCCAQVASKAAARCCTQVLSKLLCASALRQLLRASALRMRSVQVGLCKLLCASCSVQAPCACALRKLLCALRKCSAPVAPRKRFACVLCASCSAQVLCAISLCKLLCASCSAQVTLRKLLCASAAGAVGMYFASICVPKSCAFPAGAAGFKLGAVQHASTFKYKRSTRSPNMKPRKNKARPKRPQFFLPGLLQVALFPGHWCAWNRRRIDPPKCEKARQRVSLHTHAVLAGRGTRAHAPRVRRPGPETKRPGGHQ